MKSPFQNSGDVVQQGMERSPGPLFHHQKDVIGYAGCSVLHLFLREACNMSNCKPTLASDIGFVLSDSVMEVSCDVFKY